MPKVSKKIRSPALNNSGSRQHDPLGQVIQKDDDKYAVHGGRRRGRRKIKDRAIEGGGDGLLDAESSQRILELSRAQQLEVEAEEERKSLRTAGRPKRVRDDDESDQEEEDNDDDDGDDDYQVTVDQGYVTVVEGDQLSAEDRALVDSLMGCSENESAERRTLADVILEKIHDKETQQRSQSVQQRRDTAGADEDDDDELPEKVVQVYTDIGKVLSRYTAGKLPKAFKVIPSLSNWERVLLLTRPDHWTPQATYAATRIFASNLNPKMAQRFYYFVLLEACRADIGANKKLNYHYYQSLKKAVYKPAAFFKGILLPLARVDNSCTLREAVIVASVLARVSIPVHHAAVAVHKLAAMTEYSPAASIFIKTLLNKKYSLPAPVISSLVQHFASFIHTAKNNNKSAAVPVLWHQALLVFCQRYKHEVQDEARESLRLVLKKHYHPKITPEIRRELFGASAYQDERNRIMAGGGGSGSRGGGDDDGDGCGGSGMVICR